MLILLKTICFGLWFFMMIQLILAYQVKSRQSDLFSLHLEDPTQAEMQIYHSLRHLRPEVQLNLEISEYHPACSELYFIASCISRKNPSISINPSWLQGTTTNDNGYSAGGKTETFLNK